MPIYEYECEKCHQRYEVFQNFNAPPMTKCEACGAEVHRVISRPAILFKGSGFHVTDYKGSSGQQSPSTSNGEGKKSDSGTKSEGNTPSSPKPDSSKSDSTPKE